MPRNNTALIAFAGITTEALAAGTDGVDSSARICLSLYARGNFESLSWTSQHGSSFESRLFAAYLLFRRNPKLYRSNFIEALPQNEKQYIAYVSIPSSLVIDPGAETYKVSMKGVPWPISFWEIHGAACRLARQGDKTCIRSVLALSRYGDGEIGEGMNEDARRLFDTPATVAKHWALFKSHIDSLSCIRDDFSAEQIEKIKQGYVSAFSHDQVTLKRILELIENGER
jgi:hypothetical protein